MNKEINSLSALGGTLLILGFISLMFYNVAYVTPLVFVVGAVFLVAGIMTLDNRPK